MTHAILRAPLSWVDTNPSGRILNRFTSDMFLVDRRLPGDLGNFLQNIFQLIVTIIASLSVSFYVILAGIILMVIYARVASIYIHVAREVKRLNSISNSPIYDQVCYSRKPLSGRSCSVLLLCFFCAIADLQIESLALSCPVSPPSEPSTGPTFTWSECSSSSIIPTKQAGPRTLAGDGCLSV